MQDEVRGRRLIAIFLLGMVLLNLPLVAFVDAGPALLGIPSLVAYLFLAWAGIIALLWLIVDFKKPR